MSGARALEDSILIYGIDQTRQTLRVFISHRVAGQSWQIDQSEPQPESVDFSAGGGVPSWTIKVEGRPLAVSVTVLP